MTTLGYLGHYSLPDRDVSIKQEWACRTYRCVKVITVGEDAEEENIF